MKLVSDENKGFDRFLPSTIRGKLYLVSDNKSYAPYDVAADDIVEIWEAKAFISVNFPMPGTEEEMTLGKLTDIVAEIKHDIVKIKDHLT